MFAAACLALALLCPPARGREPTEAEAWAAAALARGSARFVEREGCGGFDERAAPAAADACRTVGAGVLRAALLAPPGAGAAEDRRLVLSDAVVEGELDLSGAEVEKAVTFERVRFTGPVRMRGAVLRGEVTMSHVAFADAWSARGLRLSRALAISDAAFDGDVDGRELVSDDLVRVDRTTFAKDFRLGRMKARTGLLLLNTAVKGQTELEQSEPGFNLLIEGTAFEGAFTATAMRGNLAAFLKSRFGQGIELSAANVRDLVVEEAEVGKADAHAFVLARATFGDVDLRTSRFSGRIDANHVSGLRFGLRDSSIERDVVLQNASLKGLLGVSRTAVKGTLNLVGVSSGSIEIVGDTGKRVSTGTLDAVGIRTTGNTVLSSLDVGGDLSIDGQITGLFVSDVNVTRQLNLNSVSAGRDIHLISISAGEIYAAGISARDLLLQGMISTSRHIWLWDVAGRDLTVRNVTSADDLTLFRSKIAGFSRFEQVRARRIDLTRLATAKLSLQGFATESLVIRDTSVEGRGDVRTSGTQSFGPNDAQRAGLRSLSMQDVSFGNLDLSIPDEAEIRLEDVRWKAISPCPEAARPAGSKPHLDADASCLRRLLDRNRFDGAQPYVQAATVYADAGHTLLADEFRFLGRQRQSASLPERAVEAVIGYGIGTYAYRVFYWIAGLSAVAAAVLYGTVPAARAKGPLWCFGAGLNQLLPVVTLNKEFGDFFNDPGRERLRGWQVAFFAVLSLLGWALGLFVVAAVAGLTQKV